MTMHTNLQSKFVQASSSPLNNVSLSGITALAAICQNKCQHRHAFLCMTKVHIIIVASSELQNIQLRHEKNCIKNRC